MCWGRSLELPWSAATAWDGLAASAMRVRWLVESKNNIQSAKPDGRYSAVHQHSIWHVILQWRNFWPCTVTPHTRSRRRRLQSQTRIDRLLKSSWTHDGCIADCALGVTKHFNQGMTRRLCCPCQILAAGWYQSWQRWWGDRWLANAMISWYWMLIKCQPSSSAFHVTNLKLFHSDLVFYGYKLWLAQKMSDRIWKILQTNEIRAALINIQKCYEMIGSQHHNTNPQ